MRVSTTCKTYRYPQPIINHSMIFKTFDSKIDKWTSKIGIFGKSFNELGTAVNNAFKSVIENLDNFDENVGFWESLKNNLFSKQTDKDWLKNSLGEIISKENIDGYIKELDLESAKEKLADIFDWENLVKNGDATWGEYFETLKDGTEKYIPDLIKNTDDLSKLTGEDLVKANQQARASALAHNEAIKAQTLSAKVGKVALHALAMAGNMLAMWGITEIASTIHSCITASDRLQESAKDLVSQFSSTESDIEGYKTKINDLYKVINDSSSSYEDTYNARQQLLTIQDEMIEKFGSEAEAVQLVTTAINGQTEALDSLTKQKWQETVNEFTNGSDKKLTERVGDSWANLWSGASNNFDRMIKEMENTEVNFRVIPRYDDEGTYEEFSKKLKENFGASITHTERDDVFTLSGDLDDIYDQLLNIQSLATNMGIDDSFLPDLSRQADETKKTLESYQEIYSQHILYDKIFDSDAYEKSFNDINDAYKKYQETFASGNDEAIETAKQSFAEIVQGATEGISDQSVIDYFNSMYPDLQEFVGGWEFEVKFKAAIDDDADNFENEVKGAISKFDSSNEVLNFRSKTSSQEQIDAYAQLNSIADEYNYTLEQLIVKLEQLGLISSNIKIDLRDKLSNDTQDLVIDDWVVTLTDDEAKLANSTAFDEALKRQKENLDGAALSAENYSAALEDVKAQQNDIETNEIAVSPLSISQTIDQLNTQIKPAFDSLQSAWQEIFTDDGFALNSIDILSTCDSIKSKLDEMSEVGLEVDYSAFEDLVTVLNNTESTEQDVENAFDSLATSITNAGLSGTEDFETMKAALEDLGVVNNEMVAFDNLISKTNALADAGIDLANATEAEMQAFVNESVSAENAGEALALLHLKKALVNQETITTAADCQNILELAQAANVGIAYLNQLNTLMNLITQRDSAHASGDSRAVSELNRAIKDFSANIVDNLKLDDVKVDFTPIGSGAKSAGKSAGKDYKDGLKEELNDLNSVISGITGRIDDQISTIRSQKEAALESIDAQIDALNEQKSALEAQKKALEEAKEAAIDALEKERDARIEVIEQQQKQLEQQIKLIDKQIKDKEKVIKSIETEIKAMTDANEQRKRAIDLQKAQYELERLQNQRTILVD